MLLFAWNTCSILALPPRLRSPLLWRNQLGVFLFSISLNRFLRRRPVGRQVPQRHRPRPLRVARGAPHDAGDGSTTVDVLCYTCAIPALPAHNSFVHCDKESTTLTTKFGMGRARSRERASQSRSNRLGLGEFADPWGALPGLLGKLHYLEALTIQHPEAAAELSEIRVPVAMAFVEHNLEWQRQPPNESTVQADPKVAEALFTAFAEAFGNVIPFDRPTEPGPSYPALPSDAPVMVALMNEVERALRRLGWWMGWWGLPAQDLTWCLVVAFWALAASDDGRSVEGTGDSGVDKPADLGADMALLDRDRLKALSERVRPWLDQIPTTPDPEAFGNYLGTMLATVVGRAAPVVVPPMSWNGRVETRAAAEERMRRAAEEAIRAQLDAAEAQLAAEGAERTPTKTTGLDHFQWLVLYQVDGLSHRAIGDAVFRHRQAVRTAISDTAKLIGLPLRPPAAAGRPRSSGRRAA